MGLYRRLIGRYIRSPLGVWFTLHVTHRIDKRLMRWSNGSLSMAFGSDYGDNSVLLRCIGAQSGKARDVPVFAFEHDGGWVLIASAGGQHRNPVSCVAHEAQGEERERAWKAADAGYSGCTEYQQRTQRAIPVMVLRPEDHSS